ncbi:MULTISPECIES: alpha/beta hydrolase [unclassified Duganella]|uniref:alpha/beta hydrolase n=1 Tax=unclassified Duganella TaxID=2636909 RepID=UPI000882E14D|nr:MULTISPECIES: alpha/beta hydrolase [unclassified Duganella]SDG57137.1 Pimeloyl-ACP methyl ester carboxylesterase [Duganella sp. OV458]SDJ80128.1 Pimeloyl-ACP methyl ester carboxylesterase [Duganella sp. OV510]
MSKPKLHFAHANSYPAGVYRQLFTLLADDFDIQTLDMHAHDLRYPVTDGWPHLVDEYINELTTRYNEPVILVGHSLGGMLSLMVAHQRPDLVRCVVMLDAPVVGGWRAFAWRIIKLLGRAYTVPPAKFSIRRRNVWPSVEAAYQHFAAKDIFAAWAPGVLGDYMDSGLKPHPDGVQLRFTRENETAVYATLPHHLPKLLRNGYPVPIGFIGGDNSWETSQSGHHYTKALVGQHFRIIPGGHLFPMETPAAAAEATREMIVALLSGFSVKSRAL